MEENLGKCPVGEALKVIGGKWRLQIVYEIGNGPVRYGVIKRSIPGISEKMLNQELKALVSLGVLNRKSYNEMPPKVEYSLSEYGKKVLPIIEQIEMFGYDIIRNNT
jgi:DNA-binding HxlR family transcriptional regulator